MKGVDGTYRGTGASMFLCMGFIPDLFWTQNLTTPGVNAFWSRTMLLAAAMEGIVISNTFGTIADHAATEGFLIYEGGETLTSAQAGTTTYGEGVYLRPDNKDWRYGTDKQPGGGSGEGDSDTISAWVLDTPGNRSGHFNEDVISTAGHIEAGSPIQIDGLWYQIVSVTAGAGEADDEVVLNKAAPSGRIGKIMGRYGYTPMLAGESTPAGLNLQQTTLANADSAIYSFFALKFDN